MPIRSPEILNERAIIRRDDVTVRSGEKALSLFISFRRITA